MNDILPPKRPLSMSAPKQKAPATVPPAPQAQPLKLEAPARPPLLPTKKRRHVVRWVVLSLVGLMIIIAASGCLWYKLALRPVDAQNATRMRVKIIKGMSPSAIGELLEQKKLIRSRYAFEIYTRLSSARGELQAGTYNLSPSESLGSIVDDLVKGNVDQFEITFLPGATLAEDRDVLLKAGYSGADIDAAFAAHYSGTLFSDKPAGTTLEGYIYGETYAFTGDASVQAILQKTFDEYATVLAQHDIIGGLKKQGLNLYQGITLASIVQREVSGIADQRQVAQVFYKRLKLDMPLGSDVTYQYAAKLLGVAPSPTLESPYNTRIHKGLPPGPISMPGLTALEAVANPAPGDYLYFLSGDDDKTYFAMTDEEHQANIEKYCKTKCSIP